MQNPFTLFGQSQTNANPQDTRKRYDEILTSSEVVIFMKGDADFPQCGFSANTVGIFKALGVPFKTFDILSDATMRQAAKEFSGWPTYPQVYFRGQLLGGNDVITEMYQNGELQEVLQAK